jgi:hypothetical protein
MPSEVAATAPAPAALLPRADPTRARRRAGRAGREPTIAPHLDRAVRAGLVPSAAMRQAREVVVAPALRLRPPSPPQLEPSDWRLARPELLVTERRGRRWAGWGRQSHTIGPDAIWSLT